jgi:uncharacterized protein (TIGR01244 family)
MLKTLRTAVGYVGTLIARKLPARLRGKEITSIFNFVPIDDGIATGGQPTEEQLAAVKQAGYDVVINLAPDSGENSLPDERSTVTSLGMRYVHIPVDFKNPTQDDFDQFCVAMRDAEDKKVLVHCAANMRVSAFMYRYRCEVRGESPQLAQQSLDLIWSPPGVWKKFIAPGGER